MIEIRIKPHKNIAEDFYLFEKEIKAAGFQILNKREINLENYSNSIEIIINIFTRTQAKTVHELAYKYFGKSYVFLSLAA